MIEQKLKDIYFLLEYLLKKPWNLFTIDSQTTTVVCLVILFIINCKRNDISQLYPNKPREKTVDKQKKKSFVRPNKSKKIISRKRIKKHQELEVINELNGSLTYLANDLDLELASAGLEDTLESSVEENLQVLRYQNLECTDKPIINQQFSLFVQLLINPPKPDAVGLIFEDTGEPDKLPEVEVVLRASTFDVRGNDSQFMKLKRDNKSEVKFVLTPRQLGEQQISADFYQNDRYNGTAYRNILVVEQPVDVDVLQPELPLFIELKSSPKVPPPDLELRVVLERHDGRTLYFELHSTKEEIDYNHAKFGQVTLQDSPMQKMHAVYQELSDLAAQTPTSQNERDAEQRKLTSVGSPLPHSTTQDSQERAERRLASVGNQLWDDLIPNELKQEYWKFKSHVTSIIITSDEPWVPWEMIKPYRHNNGKEDQDSFWCHQFAISRWLSGPGTADELPAETVVPVAPVQSDLLSVKEEITFLEKLNDLRSGIIPVTAISRGLDLEDYLKENVFSILHFACHGMFDDTLPDDSAIMLADGPLRPSDMRLYFAQKCPRPLIFINACHGGRLGFSFTGIGGWAEQFVKARVGAFVGAMWEVNDTLALQFAKTFYKALLQDNQTIAEAFRHSREVIRQAAPYNSTWLAYSLYADPEARIQEKN